ERRRDATLVHRLDRLERGCDLDCQLWGVLGQQRRRNEMVVEVESPGVGRLVSRASARQAGGQGRCGEAPEKFTSGGSNIVQNALVSAAILRGMQSSVKLALWANC